MKKDVYELVTERIVAGLKDKGLSWFKPWTNRYGEFELPINNSTGRRYNGFNVFWLSMEMDAKGFESNEWLTFRQCLKANGRVKIAENKNYTEVVNWMISYYDKESKKWYKAHEVKDLPQEVQDRLYKSFKPITHNVYNIAQCTGIEARRKPQIKDTENTFSPIKDAENVYINYKGKPSLKHGGSRAYYRPSSHHVQMPEGNDFISSDDYYKTLYHELVHSTGHESVLKRKTLTDMAIANSSTKKMLYSQEELVAEIGSEFLVAITGIVPKDNAKNSQAYINGWIKHLTDHPKEALNASSQAQKAVEYILKG